MICSEPTFDKGPESEYHIWVRTMFWKAWGDAAASGMH